jgi:hypothetical protein
MTDHTAPPDRAGYFPLEVTDEALSALLTNAVETVDQDTIHEYVDRLLSQVMSSSTRDNARENPKIAEPVKLATLTALATVRAEIADPHLSLTNEYNPEKKHLQTPLRTNPGLSQLAQHIREYYVNTLVGLLGTYDDQQLLTEAAAILFTMQAPRIPDLPDGPLRFYADLGPRARSAFRDQHVQVHDEHITIPVEAATQRCRAHESTESLPAATTTEDHLRIPRAVLRAKLETYAGHGYNKLVHTAFHAIPPHVVTTLKHNTPEFRNRLDKKFYGHEAGVYEALYTSATKHPNATRTEHGLVPDRRIVGIVNTISAVPRLSFNHFYTARDLADAARAYFPPPHQPSLSQLTPPRISHTLKTMAERYGSPTGLFTQDADLHFLDIVRYTDQNGGLVKYALREPTYSPIYTPPEPKFTHPWDAYKQLLTKQARHSLPDKPRGQSTLDELAPGNYTPIAQAKKNARRAIATTPHERPLADVAPHTTPARSSTASNHDYPPSQDELVYLTRIAYALQRRLTNIDITDGMASLDEGLNVDPETLAEAGWIEPHEDPRHTLYSLSSDDMRALGIPPTTNETYGDTVFEKALHRFCTYRLKQTLQQKRDVDTVYTYYNLWRLGVTDSEIQNGTNAHDAIEIDVSEFRNSRADVIAFDADGTVTHAGEVQTSSENPVAPVKNWDKLAVLANQGATPHWYFPTGDHAGDTLEKLYRSDRIDAASIYSTNNSYRYTPAKWRDWLKTHDPENIAIQPDNLHALRDS